MSSTTPDEQKAALVRNSRTSDAARWEILTCTRPTDELTLDAFAEGADYTHSRRVVLDIVDLWRNGWSAWERNASDKLSADEDRAFINSRVRNLHKNGLLSSAAFVRAEADGNPVVSGSTLAWLAAATDSGLLGEVLNDPDVHPAAFKHTLANPDAPTSVVNEIVLRMLDDALTEFRATEPEYGWRRRPESIDVIRSCAGAVQLLPATVERLVDAYKEFYPGYASGDDDRDELAFVGRLPGIDLQPYPVDVQHLLVDRTGLWFRKAMMARNPNVDPGVLAGMTVRILNSPMEKGKGGHRKTVDLLRRCLTSDRLDLTAVRPYVAKERRVGIRRVMKSALVESLRHSIFRVERFGDPADFSRMCLLYLIVTDVREPGHSVSVGENTIKKMLAVLPEGQTVTTLAESDDPHVREFASRIVVSAAVL